MTKYKVRYWERQSAERIIEAESDAEARRKMQDVICSGGIDLSFAELDDCGTEAVVATKLDLETIPPLTEE